MTPFGRPARPSTESHEAQQCQPKQAALVSFKVHQSVDGTHCGSSVALSEPPHHKVKTAPATLAQCPGFGACPSCPRSSLRISLRRAIRDRRCPTRRRGSAPRARGLMRHRQAYRTPRKIRRFQPFPSPPDRCRFPLSPWCCGSTDAPWARPGNRVRESILWPRRCNPPCNRPRRIAASPPCQPTCAPTLASDSRWNWNSPASRSRWWATDSICSPRAWIRAWKVSPSATAIAGSTRCPRSCRPATRSRTSTSSRSPWAARWDWIQPHRRT